MYHAYFINPTLWDAHRISWKKNMQQMNIPGLSDYCKGVIWMGWEHRTDVPGAGWNPRL